MQLVLDEKEEQVLGVKWKLSWKKQLPFAQLF